MKLFPLDAGVSQIRGIVEMIKDNKNSIEVSKLAEQANNEIDELFPLIDACVILELCTVKNGVVRLTKSGMNMAKHNTREVLSKALNKVEPFKSAISVMAKEKRISTKELASELYRKGILFNTDEITNIELLKSLLFKWGVANNLFSYNNDSDTWSISKNAMRKNPKGSKK
jgi:NitT/TauT family transport system ATP-binding protein